MAQRKDDQRLQQIEVEQVEAQVGNLEERVRAEKRAFEQDPKERLLTAIREQQRDVEDKKKEIAEREAELVREKRLLESQQELLVFDRAEMKRTWEKMAVEREEFEEMHRSIRANHDTLALERDRTMKEKTVYEADLDKCMKGKNDIAL